MTKAVAGHEDGTVKFMKSYIRAAELTEEQKLIAAKMLKAYFAA